MADVKWIKITTDVFDDEKMLMIEGLPSADSIIVIWFKLLIFAGKQNNDGVFIMNNRIAYTDEMLASIFRRDVNTVRFALATFEQYGMIEVVDNVITIPNWNKHQTLDVYEKKKERDRLYQARRRAEQRALIEKSSDNRLTSGDSSPSIAVSEEDIERDIEEDIDIRDISSDSDESSAPPEPPVPPKKPKAKKEKPTKHKHGEYQHVLLTDAEYERLCAEFGEEFINKVIKFFDEYIEEKGYKSQSHNLAIRRWVIDAVKEKEAKQQGRPQAKKPNGYNQAPQRQYDMTSLEAQLLNADKPKEHNDP